MSRLHALYAQLIRITPAPLVLPRRLALSLAGASFINNVNIFFIDSALQKVSCSSNHTLDIAESSLRSLFNIPHCCLP